MRGFVVARFVRVARCLPVAGLSSAVNRDGGLARKNRGCAFVRPRRGKPLDPEAPFKGGNAG